jgi:hypothetical protein
MHPKSQRGVAVWTTVVFLVVLALYIGLFIVPYSRKLSSLKKQEGDLAEQVAAMNLKNRQLPLMREGKGAMVAAAERVNELLPEGVNQRKILFYLNEDAVKHNLSVQGFEIHAPTVHPLTKVGEDKRTDEEKALDKDLVARLQVVTFKITVNGKYADVLAFMDELKGSNRLLNVYRLACPQSMPKGDYVDYVAVAMDGEAYFYLPAAPPGPKQPSIDPFTKFLQEEGSPHLVPPGQGPRVPLVPPPRGAPAGKPVVPGATKAEREMMKQLQEGQ